MKHLVFLFAFSALTIQSCSRYSAYENVPDQVIAAFETKFSEVENVAWSLTSNGDWMGKFSVYHNGYSAFFNEKGEWLETDHKIITSAVPLNVKLALHDNYQQYEIESVFVAEKQSGKFFEMAIMTHGHVLDVEANSLGTLTKEEEHK